MINARALPSDFDLGGLISLVGQIYETVTDPSVLTSALDSLAGVVRGSAAQVYTYDNESGRIVDSMISSSLREVDNRAYVGYYGGIDPRLPHVMAMPVGTGNRCHAWFDERFVSGNEFYQDFFIPAGFRWVVGSKFDAGNGTLGVLAALRAVDAPACEDWTVEVMNELAPHFRRASALRARLARSDLGLVSFETIVGNLPTPAALFGSTGELLYDNQRCRQLWRELPLRIEHSTLRMESSRDQSAWTAARHSAVMHKVPGSFRLRARDGVAWRFDVVPCELGGAAASAESGLVMLMAERITMTVSEKAALFGRRHRFTVAQAEVLAMLMDGMSLAEIAVHRGVEYRTVSSQVQSMFDGTGLRSQGKLIAAAMRL